MTKDDIIMDWLQSPENRKRLTVLAVDKSTLDVFKAHAAIYSTSDGEVVYSIGENIYHLISRDVLKLNGNG